MVSLWDRQVLNVYLVCTVYLCMGVLIQPAACEPSPAANAAKKASAVLGAFVGGLKQAPVIYLVVNEAYVSREYRGDPVTAQLDVDVLR